MAAKSGSGSTLLGRVRPNSGLRVRPQAGEEKCAPEWSSPRGAVSNVKGVQAGNDIRSEGPGTCLSVSREIESDACCSGFRSEVPSRSAAGDPGRPNFEHIYHHNSLGELARLAGKAGTAKLRRRKLTTDMTAHMFPNHVSCTSECMQAAALLFLVFTGIRRRLALLVVIQGLGVANRE